jgi:hypothetical protein
MIDLYVVHHLWSGPGTTPKPVGVSAKPVCSVATNLDAAPDPHPKTETVISGLGLLEPRAWARTAEALQRTITHADEAPCEVIAAKTPEAVLEGWPLRAERADVLFLRERARSRGWDIALDRAANTLEIVYLKVSADGRLIAERAERGDFGRSEQEPANAELLASLGVHSAVDLDRLIAAAVERERTRPGPRSTFTA